MVRVLLLLWTVLVVLAGALLTSLHAPFRTPPVTLQRQRLPEGGGQGWQARHFVSAACVCSTRVLGDLAKRTPMPGWVEQVVFVEDPALKALPAAKELEDRVRGKGFEIRHVDGAAQAGAAGIRGVPTLVVLDARGRTVYSGGYGTGYDQSAAILQEVQSGSAVRRRPAAGCALGSMWKKRLALLAVTN